MKSAEMHTYMAKNSQIISTLYHQMFLNVQLSWIKRSYIVLVLLEIEQRNSLLHHFPDHIQTQSPMLDIKSYSSHELES